MKAKFQIETLPENGVVVIVEGQLLRLFFDFTKSEKTEEREEVEDMYDCESVDVNGRTYGDIVSAIMNDRYSADDVQAIMANYTEALDGESSIPEEKRQEYKEEYATYQQCRKHAKEIAKKVVDTIG